MNTTDLYDADPPQQPEVPPQRNAKARNIAALFRNPRTAPVARLTIAAVVVVFSLALVALIAKSKRNDAAVQPTPVALQGADVGAAPLSVGASTQSGAASSPEYAEIVRGLEAQRAASAAEAGFSSQPSAQTVEADLRPAATPEERLRQDEERRRIAALEEAAARSGTKPPPIQDPDYGQRPGQQQSRMTEKQAEIVREAVARLVSKPSGAEQFNFGDGSAAQSLPRQGIAGSYGGPDSARPVPAPAQTAAAFQGAVPQATIIDAGTIEAGEMLTAVNTERGRKFAVRLVTGRYAGAVLVGEYKRSGDVADGTLSQITIPGYGGPLPTSAEILNPDTLEAGYATDVDRKLILKYGVKPIASGFAAVADYLRNSGNTVITNGTTTISTQPELTGKRAAQIVGSAAAQAVVNDTNALDTTPVARIAARTIVGVFFTDSVRLNTAR